MDGPFRDLPLHPDVKRYIEATRQANLEERAALMRFGPVLCRCHKWYDWRDPVAPQEDCYVHTTVMFDQDGELMS
jgi:hypothetical protein